MPDFSSTHVDAILTRISRQYPLGSVMVADVVAPHVNVGKESGLYFRYDKGDQARIPFTKRQLKSESRRVDWRMDTDSYKCEEYALNDLIDDREYKQADTPLNLQRDTLENLQRLMMLDREKRVYDLVSSTTTVTKNTTLTGTKQWRDGSASGATSEPIYDIDAGSESIRENTGVRPNLAIFGIEAWRAFQKNSQVVDKITTPGGNWGSPTITVDIAMTLLSQYGITRVLVPDMIQNTAGFGVTDSFSDIWPDTVLLSFTTPSPGIKKISFAYTFWSQNWMVRRSRIETQHSDWFEPSYVADEKIIAADVAYLIKDVSDGT